jgi:AraC-like DNA-binding protein/mannose-6-phosphate isomerase-like protein (cupin superfamily)
MPERQRQFTSVQCHRFREANFVNALGPLPGKRQVLYFPVRNSGVVWHNGNWQDILGNRVFCIEADTEFSVRCGEGPVDCFAISFDAPAEERVLVNDYIVVQPDLRAEFVDMNVELAMACLAEDAERSSRLLRGILDHVGQMTMATRIAFAIRHWGRAVDVPDHTHSDEYQIEYFAAGAGGVRLDKRWMEFGRGSFCFIPPKVSHGIFYQQAVDADNYSMKFQFIEDPRIKNPPDAPFMVDVAEEKQPEVLALLKKIVGEYTMDRPISPDSLNRLITLAHEIQEHGDAIGRRISLTNRVKRIVRATYTRPLRISGIARQVGVSPEHLSRSFRKDTGQTLADYIAVCRLRSALTMLQNTTLPIKQIASECGFTSVHYFSNRFKKYYASTPGEIRQRSGGGGGGGAVGP